MARIRTIKPEFPQSESIGKLSRDARLLYILLWTIVDDEGRARAASRMLASLLYPYDDGAFGLIDGWLLELERADKIRRYEVDGSRYLEIVKWLEHQKIDKPSKSRLPAFVEGSRTVAKVSEASATDLVPSTLDLVPSITAATPRMRSERTRKANATALPESYCLPGAISSFGAGQGLSGSELAREHQRFCNHAKQNDRRCIDWVAAERNWMIGAAEKLGRSAPRSSNDADDGLIEVLGELELIAWDEYGKQKTGKTFPRNARGGWRFPSRWPPGYVPPASSSDAPPTPMMRTM